MTQISSCNLTIAEKYNIILQKFKVTAIVDFLNNGEYTPFSARRWTKQIVINSIHHKSNHKDFVRGIEDFYEKYF